MKLRNVSDRAKGTFKAIFYIYLFVIASPLIAHGIFFGIGALELLFLSPLMAFSAFYGLSKFKKASLRMFDKE